MLGFNLVEIHDDNHNIDEASSKIELPEEVAIRATP